MQPKTMKLMGSVLGRHIKVLIDSGAIHNFLSSHMAHQLGLAASQEGMRSVKLGDGFV